MDDNKNQPIRFSISRDRSLSRVENVTWPWESFVERTKQIRTDPLTYEQFKALTKDKQAARKSAHGYFVGAQFRGSARKKMFMLERQLITLDIDQATPRILIALEQGLGELGKWEYLVYSTHSHGGGDIKLRVVIPLGKPISHDLFQAVSRITAWNIDSKMIAVDNVSFTENQLMYWPVHCADVEPVFIHHRGRLLEPMEVISDWCGPDDDRWRDMTLLPRSPREADHHDGKDRAADPLLKHGWVGAYCRSYDIHETIETFLAHIYAPSEVGPDGVPTRYTYLPGTLTNGAVVYDEGRFLFSHHGSDPCGGLNANSFDLKRVHLYGHLDKPGDAEKPPQDQPSFKAMVEACRADPIVSKELLVSNYRDISDADVDAALGEGLEGVDDLEAGVGAGEPVQAAQTGSEPPKTGNWSDGLDLDANARVKSNLHNLTLILRHSPTFKGALAFNELRNEQVLRRRFHCEPLGLSHAGGPNATLADVHQDAMRIVLEAPRGPTKPGWGLKVSDRDLTSAINQVCSENGFHPVRQWFATLKWDGVPRLDQFWIRTLHIEDTEYHRQAAWKWIVGSVARIMRPGCKMDYMPILQGPQGIMKSTLVQVFGGYEWVGEMDGHFASKRELVEATERYMILELSELHLFRRTDIEATKAMVTRTEETTRQAYARRPKSVPRQFVLIGTTNDELFLRDDTGHRRYWTIVCGSGQIDIAWAKQWREQIWAEAIVRWGDLCLTHDPMRLPLYLTDEAVPQSEEAQARHAVPDVAKSDAGLISVWLETPVPLSQSRPGNVVSDVLDPFNEESVLRDKTCGREIFSVVFGGDPARYNQTEAQRIGKAMKHVDGWVNGKMARCGVYGKQVTYVRTGVSGL